MSLRKMAFEGALADCLFRGRMCTAENMMQWSVLNA